MAATPTLGGPLNIGFLTVLQEASGFVGGYMVTNVWGRPLEFRLTSAVQPTRVHQVLYGSTLQAFVCADLIGKTLVDKTGVPPHLVVTDQESVLDLRLKVEVPVVWLGPPRTCHRLHPEDEAAVAELMGRIDPSLDLTEPFGRIREAVGEARKLGVARAA